MSKVTRIYVEKKQPFAVKAKELKEEIKGYLGILGVKNVRVLIRYDVENLSEETLKTALTAVFSEPPVDDYYLEDFDRDANSRVFGVEYLPGQFDQRADSAVQCVKFLKEDEEPVIKTATTYCLTGDITDEEFERIKAYCINPVDSRETGMVKPDTLVTVYDEPDDVKVFDGFISLDDEGLNKLYDSLGLAMTIKDFRHIRNYFENEEHRDPTMTEIRVLDTYWSDHCRHTTFSTELKDISFADGFYRTPIETSYQSYLDTREEIYKDRDDKYVCLMDLALMGMKKLRSEGKLEDMEVSDEINACSVIVPVEMEYNGEKTTEEWLVFFKNETHNHPTEIEPFGGAATCLGGAIRDPLSGRGYVYQAMRVTGAADPTVPVSETIKGKLPQKKLVKSAAAGYSSYGNQIGLATGLVKEIYHPGYVAKRMEIGAVMGAAPRENVKRLTSDPGDIIILLGGRTGRDGCGGATGSSKSHTASSLESCGAEVQKGNPPEERKLQRLFRNKDVTSMIKRCNDFGAGGVSVAIGELTDGLLIDLDSVPKKYDGLDGTEIAISESQERMAVVIAAEDTEKFMAEAAKENIEATKVADVTDDCRLRMNWNGKTIVDLSRDFLNSNGAVKHTDVRVTEPVTGITPEYSDDAEGWTQMISNLNVCSQKGLVEKFDSTIGAGTVLMPFGGVYQLTPSQAMAAKIPVLKGETTTASIMGWGYNPVISEKSPYHGAILAVIESIAKVVAAGGSSKKCWLTFQEYFERTQNDPARWGKPFAALLGALKAQLEFGCGAIGGKDSMSGTFENIDVPPTLVSFAVSTAKSGKIVSPEFKKAGSSVVLITPKYDENGLPDFDSVRRCFEKVEAIIEAGRANAVWTTAGAGVAEGIAKMCFGNKLGFRFTKKLDEEQLFAPCYGSFIVEINGATKGSESVIGEVTSDAVIDNIDYTVSVESLLNAWESKLEPVYPCIIKTEDTKPEAYRYDKKNPARPAVKIAKPRVLIPVFPGTNCEYDTARAFEKAGAVTETIVIKNLSASAIEESVNEIEKAIRNSQIIMIPGGFSGGDEPEGSGKFITAFFRNARIKDAVHELLKNRDGLMLGICNGFQALIKLGLVPFGEITDMTDESPTLTFNTIARHQSMMVRTRIASNKSPWLARTSVDQIHSIAISHGEGRFVAPEALIKKLAENGQIATQYVDMNGDPTMNIRFNPNTSMAAIEGITSPDGRVLGKMGHSERKGTDVCKNVQGDKDQFIFESGVSYFAD